MNSRQRRHKVRLRGLRIESAKADFVPLLPWSQPTVLRLGDLLMP
jgi:hypothetical protein